MANKGRKFKRYCTPFVILLLVSCSTGNVEPEQINVAQNAQNQSCKCRERKYIYGSYPNETDANGWKQGYWKFFGHMKPEKGYPENYVIEEGGYNNDRKQGKWLEYYKNGTIYKESMFSCDTLQGESKEYDYENGSIIISNYSKGKIKGVDTILFSPQNAMN